MSFNRERADNTTKNSHALFILLICFVSTSFKAILLPISFFFSFSVSTLSFIRVSFRNNFFFFFKTFRYIAFINNDLQLTCKIYKSYRSTMKIYLICESLFEEPINTLSELYVIIRNENITFTSHMEI